MYYRIKDNIALRSWKFVPRAYYIKNDPYAKGLSEEDFELLLRCDGEQDIEPSPFIDTLVYRGLIEECEKGHAPSSWSALRVCENRYFPKMNFMITGKCNFNCLHCFNAADNAPLMTEWSYDEALDLLDQARDCGINAFTITGGEPMLHPQFMELIEAIYERGMFVEELNTNGYFITQEKLDRMKSIGCRPMIKISFDGIGCHDWMRDRKGAEERTLAAMELCIKNGFRVMSQTQVHRRNLHTLLDTAKKLSSIGVSTLRLIRTTEVIRWITNAPDSCLSLEEYYTEMLKFMQEYKKMDTSMNVIIWQFLRAYPVSRSYSLDAVLCASGDMKPTDPVCKGNRGMVGVTSSGDIVPCLQMSGYFEEHGIHLGNLHRTPLKELLTDSDYSKEVCKNLYKLAKANSKCAECKMFKYCNGGCPALGLLFTGDRNGSDLSKCVFYENGWYYKVREVMDGWRNSTQIDELEAQQQH